MKTLKESILDKDFDIDEISTILNGIKFIKTGDNTYVCYDCQEEFYSLKRMLRTIAKETGKPRGSKFADMYILDIFNEYINIIQKLSGGKYLMLTISFTAYGKILSIMWVERDYNPIKVMDRDELGERVGRIPASVIKSLQIR